MGKREDACLRRDEVWTLKAWEGSGCLGTHRKALGVEVSPCEQPELQAKGFSPLDVNPPALTLLCSRPASIQW